jgi:hypothetical protein
MGERPGARTYAWNTTFVDMKYFYKRNEMLGEMLGALTFVIKSYLDILVQTVKSGLKIILNYDAVTGAERAERLEEIYGTN